MNEASVKFGKKLDVTKEQKQYMIDAGFVDVRDDAYKVFDLLFLLILLFFCIIEGWSLSLV